MPPPARFLRSHAEGLLFEGGEPGLRPLLLTPAPDGGVSCRLVAPERRASMPPRPEASSLASSSAPKVRIEGLFGVYAFSGGPYAAVVLESEPLLKRDQSTQVFADAKLRWPRDACHAFRLRRATKVAVVPVAPQSNRRLSKRQAQDEALCLRLLESALRKRPWVFSRDSDAATLTAKRASNVRDFEFAERSATKHRGSITCEDAARKRFDRSDAAFLWNRKVLAPVVEAGAAAWCCACACIIASACDLGSSDDVDEVPSPSAAIVLTRLGVDTGARLVRRGLGRDGGLTAYAETEVLVCAAATPDRPARAYAFTLSRASPPVSLEAETEGQHRGSLMKKKLSNSKRDLTSPPTPVHARHARTDARRLDGAVDALLARTKTAQVTIVDVTSRAPRASSVSAFLARRRLKLACGALAPAKRGARVRHVVVGPGDALASVPVAHDVTRLRIASKSSAQSQKTLLIVGCDEVDDVDVLMCEIALETVAQASEDGDLGPDGFAPQDPAYAAAQLRACWRRHADGIATIRCGGGACTGSAPFARLARALRGGLFDGTAQDGLDVAVGRRAPAQLVRGADERTYAWERVHLTYAKVALVALSAAAPLRAAAPAAPLVEALKQGVVAAVCGVLATHLAQAGDGSLFVAAAAKRRFDED